MIEFNAQEGGRYTYVDDIVNLQNLALAFGAIFSECDNFVVSGCEVSDTSISAGYVYVNGKLRHFTGATGITSWPQYIYELNSIENVAYASGNDKVGRNVYGCSISNKVPTTLDPITKKVPNALVVTKNGAATIKDAFFGKYALLLDATSQSVNGKVLFKEISATTVQSTSQAVYEGNGKHRSYYEGHNFVYESQYGSGANYKMVVEDGVGFRFYINGNLIMTVGSNSISFNKQISNRSSDGTALGSIVVSNGNFYNNTAAADGGEININVVGYQGAKSYTRNTNIGDGKGNNVFSVIGTTKEIVGYGTLTLSNDNADGIVFKSSLASSNTQLQKSIIWKDRDNVVIGQLGYTSNADQIFRINNTLASVDITGVSFVNIGPAIKENGVLLRNKYVIKTDLDRLITGKANASDVYSKTDADSTFAKKANGLSQFITTEHTAAKLREEIGAVSSSDVAGYAVKSKFLADMATSNEAKKKIRENIGAASTGDFQAKLKDSGWAQCSGQLGLYVRQIGNVVSIQGTIRTVHSGTVFTVPNSIDAPTHAVFKSISFNNSRNWSCQLAGGSRNCTVIFCNGSCYKDTPFSMTYMV